MKWGILGGTFDPIHTGHLRCAEEIRELFGLDQVIFIPAYQPPHKNGAYRESFEHRERMVKLAIAGNSFFSYSDLESRRGGLSYSVATVEHFLSLHPQDLEIYFILGQDAFRFIRTWKEWEKILLLCNFVVMTRPGWEEEALEALLPPDFASLFVYDEGINGYRGPAGRTIFYRRVSFLDISSSDIRERRKEGNSIRYLVPEEVFSYIEEHGCYG